MVCILDATKKQSDFEKPRLLGLVHESHDPCTLVGLLACSNRVVEKQAQDLPYLK